MVLKSLWVKALGMYSMGLSQKKYRHSDPEVSGEESVTYYSIIIYRFFAPAQDDDLEIFWDSPTYGHDLHFA